MAQLSNFVNFIQTEFSSVRDITREWVMASTENNYSDFAAISSAFTPSFYEALEAKQLLRRLQTCLSKFATENNDPEVFDELSKADVSARQISVLLWYSIEWALAEDSTFEQVEQGGFAACAYLHLCCISGATAYKVFNPYLFQKCLDVFRRFYRYLAVDPSASKSAPKKATKSKSGVVKKGKKRQCPDTELDQNDGSRAAEVDLDEAKMLLEEACAALFEILGKVSLADYAGVPLLVTLLVRDIARIDVSPGTKVDMIENVEDFKSLPRLSDRSFALMHRLMEDRHTKGGFLVISRIVYPRLSYWTFECDVISSSMAIPAVFNTWKSLMVDFIKVRVKVASDAELLNYFNVLENLYQRCTDRLEYRTRLATSLVNVLQLLPRIYQFEFVQRLDTFSYTQRAAVRNFTIEVVPLILKHLDVSGPDPGPLSKYPLVRGQQHDHSRRQSSGEVGDGGSSPPPTQSDIDMDEDGGSDISSDRSKSPESCSGKNVDGDKSDDDQEADNESNGERTPPLEILYKCFIRCTLDKASTVRVRALYHLVPLIENGHLKFLHQYARQMFEEDPRIFVGGVSEDGEERPETNLIEYGECFYDKSEIVIDDLILYVILAGCGDDVAGVRKNALTALQCYFPHITSLSDAQDAIEWLVDRCLDQSPTVRKQAAEVFDYLLTNSTSYRNILEKEWLAVVLLMINDREQSVQQLISQIIVGRIIRPLMNDDVDEATWRMLHAIELEDNNRRLLLRALLMQYQEGTLKTNVIDHLNRKLVSHPDQADAIWMLLADMSSIMTVKSNRALDAWYSIPEGDPSNRVRYVAKVLAKSSKMLDSVTKSDLCADLDRKLTGFKIDVSNISAAYYCLAILMDAVGEEATGRTSLETVGKKILNLSRSHIREALLKIDSEYDYPEILEARERILIRVITTIGEVVQFSPRLMRYAVHLLDALKTILASDVSKDDDLLVVNSAMPSLQPTPASSRAPSPAHSMMSTETSDLPSSQNVPVIYPHVLNAAAENRKALLTPRIRAHAVLTIGKFCLMDERTAKATIPIFVKQLKMNRDHVVRNNIALVICDLCVRYTSMVDRYSPIIAACLKDTSTLVRRQILESLASLIKEQFIRWEGQVMYRFVSTILDENDAIRDYTMFCLTDVLLTQFPDLFSNHFVECLMYFNNVPVSCEREVVQEVIDPSQRVTLYGPENEVNRMTIYKFMLSTFDDRLKFTAMAHMCNQIICPIMNGKLDFNDPCVQALLRDTLTIMTLEEIKLEMEVGKGPDGEEEPPAAVVAAAKEMITKTFRKALIEFVMPALLDLRVFLNEKRSSLRGPLYGAFRTICREHKDEIDAFLDGDQQLKAEVLYDIRRYEIREKVQRAVTLRKAEEAVAQRRRSRRSLAISLRPAELSRRSGLKENEGNDVEATVPPTLNATSVPQQNTSQIEDGVSRQNDIVMNEQEAVDPTAATSSSPAIGSTDSDALKISDRSRRKRSSTSGETEILPTADEPALLSTKMEVDSDGPASDMEVDDETERKRQNDKENDHISPRPPSIKRRAYQVRSVPSIANEYLEENSQIIDDGALSDRAVSTPIKPMPNLTFRNLELSAIETDQKRTSRLGKGQLPGRSNMPEIEEGDS